MDRYPATAPADTSVAEAARLMDRHQSRFLLVTGEDGKLLGVVTARDLLRVLLRPDEAIKAEISRDVLSRYLGTNPALVQVDVTEGVVRLTGGSSARACSPRCCRPSARWTGYQTWRGRAPV